MEASARAAGGEARRCRHQCAAALPSHRLAGFDHLCAIRSCCLQLGTQVSTWPPMSPSQLIVLLKVLERLTLRYEPPRGAALLRTARTSTRSTLSLRLSRCIGTHSDSPRCIGDAHQAPVSAGGELWRPIGPTRSRSCSANRTSRRATHSLHWSGAAQCRSFRKQRLRADAIRITVITGCEHRTDKTTADSADWLRPTAWSTAAILNGCRCVHRGCNRTALLRRTVRTVACVCTHTACLPLQPVPSRATGAGGAQRCVRRTAAQRHAGAHQARAGKPRQPL